MSQCQPRPRAFTLVELLVVVGIIALLISILLPVLGRAREAGNKVKCLSNLRQLGLAMYQYTLDNKGYFPANAPYSTERPDDWIFFQPDRAASVPPGADYHDYGAIQKYMGKFNPGLYQCPSDTLQLPRAGAAPGAPDYPYSYTMNYILGCNLSDNNPRDVQYIGGQVAKMTRIHHTSDVVMLLEESEATVNDGVSFVVLMYQDTPTSFPRPIIVPNNPPNHYDDFLALRHDLHVHRPDDQYVAGIDTGNIPNTQRSGNVAFCDGHADYVTREFVHSPVLRHWDPTY